MPDNDHAFLTGTCECRAFDRFIVGLFMVGALVVVAAIVRSIQQETARPAAQVEVEAR